MPTSIFIAGDVVPYHRTVSLFKDRQTDYLFNDIIPIIQSADIRIVNLEAPIIAGRESPIRKFGPCLYTSKETLEVLKEAGFDTITLANNHFRDQGQTGVETTINIAKTLGVDYVGGGVSFEEAKNILYKKVRNKRIAIINVCENEFSIATQKYGGSNPLDIISVYEDIQKAKKEADHVILIIHGGVEHYQYPTPRMKRTYRHFIDIGADAVVNHHQHCFSGYEVYQNKPIFYGLGNFCFDKKGKKDSIWNEGLAVILKIESDKITFDILSYKQCDEEPRLNLLDNDYSEVINQINEIIRDDKCLTLKFDSYIQTVKRDFLYRISPYENHYLSALYRRGYIKSLFSRTKEFMIKNLLCCESHLEILSAIFKQKTI